MVVLSWQQGQNPGKLAVTDAPELVAAEAVAPGSSATWNSVGHVPRRPQQKLLIRQLSASLVWHTERVTHRLGPRLGRGGVKVAISRELEFRLVFGEGEGLTLIEGGSGSESAGLVNSEART